MLDYLETVETNNERPMRTVGFTNGGVLHEPSRAGRMASVDLCEADLADWSPPADPVSVSGRSPSHGAAAPRVALLGRDSELAFNCERSGDGSAVLLVRL